LKINRKKRSFKIEPLTEKEADDLLEQAKLVMGGYYHPHILCALRTGMRIGEIKALKWKDIDFEKRQIEVRRSCRRGRITGTKTDKRRRVDMTPHLTDALRELKTRQKRLSLKNAQPVPEWVFAGKKGQILSRVAFENALNRCLEDAKLRHIRIHDLRHTYQQSG